MSLITKLLLFFIAMTVNQVVICLVIQICGETKEVVISNFALSTAIWMMIGSSFSKGDAK